ncbi:MAG: DUF364 domain-containing protein, partial [Anaerolineae bacterium]|nr:DUF364 domain-containing protein [Anaerolineae bacterium]
MSVIDDLLLEVTARTERAQVKDVRIGAHWTGVMVELNGKIYGGLSSNLGGSDDHHHGGRMPVQDAGQLLVDYSARELAGMAHSTSVAEASVGFAVINALLDVDEAACVEVNAADVLAEKGAGKRVAVVGHFPFIPQLRGITESLWVLELHPRAGDLPASQAVEVLPQADVIALTGTSLLNHTFDELIARCRPDAFVVMLGGTTPLSPVLFNYGVDAVAGTVLVDPEPALRAISQ